MIRRAAFVCLMLAACSPQTPTEAPAAEQPAAPVAPAEQAAPVLAADEIPAPAGEITVTSLTPGARVSSPLVVEGSVTNSWMFEGVFPAELASGGEVIVQAPAEQQAPDNWTNPGPVRFKATLTFVVTKETPAELILREDMPKPVSADSDEPGPARTLRIPVVLVPAN
jgi:hypothetical protein